LWHFATGSQPGICVSFRVSAAAAWPLAGRAQQAPPRSPLIAILSPITPAAAARNIAALRFGLRELGYVEGRNITLELRFAEGVPGRLAQLAAELAALKPDVILAGSTGGITAVRDATRTIPIVMVGTLDDPVAMGLVESIARPGGNVTGTWLFGDDALVGKRLEFLKHVVPGLARIGVIINPGDAADAIVLKRLPAAARALGIDSEVFQVRAAADFEAVFAAAAGRGTQALFVSQSPLFSANRARVTAIVAGTRLPAVYGFREFTEAGGLMSYGANLPAVYQRSASLVDKILKGAKPADLPIEIPTRFELVVNLKTAKAMGIAIPDSFVTLADEVIE
jgi:putative ABC transport system substrate-binding protein